MYKTPAGYLLNEFRVRILVEGSCAFLGFVYRTAAKIKAKHLFQKDSHSLLGYPKSNARVYYKRPKILAEFPVCPGAVMVSKDRLASWAPVEVEQKLRDPPFNSRRPELQVNDRLTALLVLIEYFAAATKTT